MGSFTLKRKTAARKKTAVWFAIFLNLLLFTENIQAQFSTPTIDATFDGSGSYPTNYVSGSTTWNMTWNDTDLFVFLQNANETEPVTIYLDVDPIVPINGGSNTDGTLVGLNYDGYSTRPNLPFRADIVIYCHSGYREIFRRDGANGWTSLGGSTTSGFTGDGTSDYTGNTNGKYSSNNNGNGAGNDDRREFRISWSRLLGSINSGNRPASFNWMGYVSYSNGMYAPVPVENYNGNNVTGNSNGLTRYFTVSTTANGTSTNPVEKNSYTHPITADNNSFGTISVWDFTLNSSGKQISRLNSGGNWTISGDLVVNAGTIYFGSGGSGYGTTNVAGNLNLLGGIVNMDQTNQSLNISGNVTVASGAELKLSGTAGGDLTTGGNFTNNGTFTHSNRALILNGAGTQTLNGTLNATGSANCFPYLIINKTGGGVTLNTPVNVTTSLTLTNGIVSTTTTTILAITNTAVGAVASASVSSFINGPLKRSLPNSGSGEWMFPVGSGATYLPFSFTNPAGTSPILTVEAKLGNAGGIIDSTLESKNTTEYWEVNATGTLVAGTISLTKDAIGSNDAVGRSATLGGTFSSLGGTITGNTIKAVTDSGANLGVFVLAKKPAPAVTSFSPTSGYTGTTVVITGTNFGSATTVSFGGTPATSFTIDSATQITAIVGAGTSGSVSVTSIVGTGSLAGFTYHSGYVTKQNGDYNTASTWLQNLVPPLNADVVILHNVALSAAATNIITSATINTGASLTFDTASATLTTTTLINNGTLNFTNAGTLNIAAGGTLNNNDTFIAGTGLINFIGASTINGSNAISFNNITINTGGLTLSTIPTINGIFRINGGFVSASPIYGNASTLLYFTASNYGVANEWTGNGTSAGTGIPQNVTIDNSTDLTMPVSSRGIAGNLTITTGSLTLSTTISADLYVAGNWTRNATATFNPNGRAVYFNGTTTQTLHITGGGTEIFNYLFIGGSGTLKLSTGTNATVNSNNGLTLASSHAASTLDLNGQTFIVNGGGTLSLASGNRKITSSLAGGIFTVSTNGLGIINPGTLEFGTTTTLILETGFDFGAGNPTTINGILQLNMNAFVNVNAPKYGASSLLKYNSGSNYERRIEWNSNIGGTYGVPHHVTISNNTTLNYPFGSTGPLGMTGDLTIDSGSKFFMDYGTLSSNGPLTVMGNIVSSGNMTLGTVAGNDLKVGGNITFNTGYSFDSKNRAVFFIKNGTQTITAPTLAPPTFHYLVFQPSSGSTTVQLNTDLTITAPNAGNVVSFSSVNDIFDLNGKTLTLGTASINNEIFGSGTFKGSITSGFTLLGNGSIGTINFTENFKDLGTFTVNRQNATTALNLGTDLTIHSSLALTKGLVFLGTSNITLTNTATHSGASANSYVIADATTTGKFKKNINNSTGAFTFPIGDKVGSDNGSNYSPAIVNFSGGDYSSTAYMALAVNDIKHPSIDASATNYLTRYWKLTSAGITESPSYSFSGTYLPTDIIGSEGNSIAGRWNGNEWTEGSAIASNTLSLSINTGATSTYTNEISAGNPLGLPEINIKGNNVNIVSGDTTPVLADFTDFGNSPTTRSSTFLIQNVVGAKGILEISNVSITGVNASDFSITTLPAAAIPVGGTCYLIIKFTPSGDGLRTAVVTITNNDPDEGNYSFSIQGQGIDYIPCSFGSEEIIASQDFEDAPLVPTLNYSIASGAATATGGTGYAESGDGGNTNKFIGAKSLQINNSTSEIIFDPIDTSVLSDVKFSFRLAAFSNVSTNSGMDAGDYIKVSISTDGLIWTDEIEINGSANSKWSFTSGLATGEAIYDGNGTVETKYSPLAGGYRTTDAYSTIALSNLPITTNLQIKITGSNNDVNEIWIIDNAIIKAKRKSKKIWTGTAWSGDGNPPTSSEIAFIEEDYDSGIVGSGFSGCECLVVAGKTLTITAGDHIDIQSDLKNEGTIVFEDSSSLLQHNETAVNIGNVTIKRATKPVFRYDYTYWSSPLTYDSGFKLGNDPISLSPGTLYDKFYKWGYDATTPAWQVIISGDEIMNPGTGYIVRAPQSFSIEGQSGAIPQVYEAAFFGKPNNGIVEHNVVGSGIEDKWNLLGNPYPSALNIETFLQFNEDYLDGTIYLWTHNTQVEATGTGSYSYSPSDYASYNMSGGVGTKGTAATNADNPSGDNINTTVPTEFLSTGQAFFVKGLDTGTVIFNNAMRVGGNNNQFFKPGPTQPINNWELTGKHRIWLNLIGQNAFNQALVGYIQNATNGLDWGYDGNHFGGNKVTLYSIIENQNLVIQGRALPFNNQDQVPLGYKTTLTGSLTISIDHYDGLFEGQDIYLEDLLLNVIHDLKASDYTFATVPGTFNNRFILRYIPQETLTNPELGNIIAQVVISKDKNELNVKSSLENISKITVYDILGRTVFTQDKINSNQFRATDIVYNRQTLIVKVQLANNAIVTKKVIF